LPSNLLETELDRKGALLGLPRYANEKLSSYKNRLISASSLRRDSSLDGLNFQVASSVQGAEAVSVLTPSGFYRLRSGASAIEVYENGSVVFSRSSNVSYEALEFALRPFFDATVLIPSPSFNCQLILPFDNLQFRSEQMSGDDIFICSGNYIETIYLPSEYEEVPDIDLIGRKKYYVDRINGCVFCGSALMGTVSYSYFSDVTVIRSPVSILGLNCFEDELQIDSLVLPLVVSSYNAAPPSNYWC